MATDIEKRARDLLIAEFGGTLQGVGTIIIGDVNFFDAAIKAIVSALTTVKIDAGMLDGAVLQLVRQDRPPPDGYVLAPVEPTKKMIEAGYGYHRAEAYKAMLAARPEVP